MEELQKLKQKLEELQKQKQVRSYPKISDSVQGIGSQLKNSIPHIVIGNQDKSNLKQLIDSEFTPRQKLFLSRLKIGGFIFCLLLIGGYALYRFLWG